MNTRVKLINMSLPPAFCVGVMSAPEIYSLDIFLVIHAVTLSMVICLYSRSLAYSSYITVTLYSLTNVSLFPQPLKTTLLPSASVSSA